MLEIPLASTACRQAWECITGIECIGSYRICSSFPSKASHLLLHCRYLHLERIQEIKCNCRNEALTIISTRNITPLQNIKQHRSPVFTENLGNIISEGQIGTLIALLPVTIRIISVLFYIQLLKEIKSHKIFDWKRYKCVEKKAKQNKELEDKTWLRMLSLYWACRVLVFYFWGWK